MVLVPPGSGVASGVLVTNPSERSFSASFGVVTAWPAIFFVVTAFFARSLVPILLAA